MKPDEPRILDEVAALIADGLPVDWSALLARHPEYATGLRELMAVSIVRRTFADSGETDTDHVGTDKP